MGKPTTPTINMATVCSQAVAVHRINPFVVLRNQSHSICYKLCSSELKPGQATQTL